MTNILKDNASGLEYIAVGATENPKHILVVLHGTGDNCKGIKPIGDAFAKRLADTLVLIPNGPVSLAEIFSPEQIEAAKKADPNFDPEQARNWAGASKIIPTDEESMDRMVKDVMTPPVNALNKLIDGQLEKFGLSSNDVVVYGFSAGGTVALHSTIQREAPCAGVISHSGHFLGADEAVSKPKTLMIFGDQELAHPQLQELFTGSADYLRLLGLSVDEHVCKDLAHGVNQESFDVACGFAESSLGVTKNIPMIKLPQPKLPKL